MSAMYLLLQKSGDLTKKHYFRLERNHTNVDKVLRNSFKLAISVNTWLSIVDRNTTSVANVVRNSV